MRGDGWKQVARIINVLRLGMCVRPASAADGGISGIHRVQRDEVDRGLFSEPVVAQGGRRAPNGLTALWEVGRRSKARASGRIPRRLKGADRTGRRPALGQQTVRINATSESSSQCQKQDPACHSAGSRARAQHCREAKPARSQLPDAYPSHRQQNCAQATARPGEALVAPCDHEPNSRPVAASATRAPPAANARPADRAQNWRVSKPKEGVDLPQQQRHEASTAR